MPYTIQARMCQFSDCTDSETYTTPTFEGALIFLKGALYGIKSRMWDHIMHNYTHFSVHHDRHPIEEITSLPESEELEIYFGSSHSNCELWVFRVSRTQ